MLFIIPPQSAATLTPDRTHVNLWHFQYEYDAMGRQIGSKAPGAGWVYTIYDRWHRPVLTQDSVQRAKSPAEWTYVKYDVHNRPVITGIMSSGSTRAGLTTDIASTYRQKSGTAWSSNSFYNEKGISYSANGNITALARCREKAGASAHIDQLAYSYSGNQLTGVSDSAPAAHKADGFGDGNTSGADYIPITATASSSRTRTRGLPPLPIT